MIAPPMARPAPQSGDVELALWLHDKFCESETCDGWERASSFGKQGWLDAAREVIVKVRASLAPATDRDAEVARIERAIPDRWRKADGTVRVEGSPRSVAEVIHDAGLRAPSLGGARHPEAGETSGIDVARCDLPG